MLTPLAGSHWTTLFARTAVSTLLFFAPVAVTHAQRADSTSTYARCGLSIIPRLSGLDVVRGNDETRVGSLAFLWPRDVSIAFSNDAESRSYAVRATGQRRIAAVLTDLGMLVAAGGVAGMLHQGGRIRGASSAALLGGAVLVGASVPIHFSADADLSRAVWRYNSAFAAEGNFELRVTACRSSTALTWN